MPLPTCERHYIGKSDMTIHMYSKCLPTADPRYSHHSQSHKFLKV